MTTEEWRKIKDAGEREALRRENIAVELLSNFLEKGMESTDVLFIKPEHPEWEYMWGLVAKHPMNKGIEEPTVADFSCEYWQYMETSLYGGEPKHCFRHRCHPNTHCREYLHLPISESLKSKTIFTEIQSRDVSGGQKEHPSSNMGNHHGYLHADSHLERTITRT